MLKIFVYSALLFIGALGSSLHCRASAFSLKELIDTLIIDSDTIYIERDLISIADDSLSENSSRTSRNNSHPWSVSLSAGVNITDTRITSNSAELIPLNDFLSIPYSPLANQVGGADFGYRFLQLPGSIGTIELSALTGYSFNKIDFGFSSVENELELNADSIVFFRGDEGILNMGYFVVTGAPGEGEVDSVDISLNRPRISSRTHDLSLKLRGTLDLGFRKTRFYAETGVIRRFVAPHSSNGVFYFMNENGYYQVLESKQIRPVNLIVPHIGLGIEKNFAEDTGNPEQLFLIGASIHASLPRSTIYNDEFLSIEISNFSFNAFVRFFL
jgi:hypothetical protein